MKVIYTPGAAYGGHEYEARQDCDSVHIYERSPRASRFTRRATMSARDFTAWRNSIAHDSANPAHISRLCNASE